MPRVARKCPAGFVYYVLNRANGRLRLFKKEDDFLAFEKGPKKVRRGITKRDAIG